MDNIKKEYQQIVELLQANQGEKVKGVMPQILELCTTKTKSNTLKYNDQGELTHVFCYYHKEWEAISEVDYGAKKNTKSGLNTMCKIGVSQWTKQQRVAKQAKEALLLAVANKEFEGDLNEELELIEQARVAIQARGES